MTTDTKICGFCGKEFERKTNKLANWQAQKYCDRKCSSSATHVATLTPEERKRRKAAYAKEYNQKYQIEYNAIRQQKRKERIATFNDYDEELCNHPLNRAQRQADLECDRRHTLEFSCRVITKDDPDFAELCKQITHIDNIPKADRSTALFAEPDGGRFAGRRHETVNSLRSN